MEKKQKEVAQGLEVPCFDWPVKVEDSSICMVIWGKLILFVYY